MYYFGNLKHTHLVNDSTYDFNLVFLEIPVKNCIVGMLWSCTFKLLKLTPVIWVDVLD